MWHATERILQDCNQMLVKSESYGGEDDFQHFCAKKKTRVHEI